MTRDDVFSYRKNLGIFIYVYIYICIQGVDIFVIENHFRFQKANIKIDIYKLRFIYYLIYYL